MKTDFGEGRYSRIDVSQKKISYNDFYNNRALRCVYNDSVHRDILKQHSDVVIPACYSQNNTCTSHVRSCDSVNDK